MRSNPHCGGVPPDSPPGVVDIALHDGDHIPGYSSKAKEWDAELNRYIEQVMRYAFREATPFLTDRTDRNAETAKNLPTCARLRRDPSPASTTSIGSLRRTRNPVRAPVPGLTKIPMMTAAHSGTPAAVFVL